VKSENKSEKWKIEGRNKSWLKAINKKQKTKEKSGSQVRTKSKKQKLDRVRSKN
jgi:hypothetical protein